MRAIENLIDFKTPFFDEKTPKAEVKKVITKSINKSLFTIDFFIVFFVYRLYIAFNAYYGPILGGISSSFIEYFL